MLPDIVIRDETPADIAAIAAVTLEAFKTLEISSNTEQFIVAALRACKPGMRAAAASSDIRLTTGSSALPTRPGSRSRACRPRCFSR